jgi:hypothetical protein
MMKADKYKKEIPRTCKYESEKWLTNQMAMGKVMDILLPHDVK